MDEKNKWALVAWENICRPKYYVGLGLRLMKNINKVLRTNLTWKISNNFNTE